MATPVVYESALDLPLLIEASTTFAEHSFPCLLISTRSSHFLHRPAAPESASYESVDRIHFPSFGHWSTTRPTIPRQIG